MTQILLTAEQIRVLAGIAEAHPDCRLWVGPYYNDPVTQGYTVYLERPCPEAEAWDGDPWEEFKTLQLPLPPDPDPDVEA